MRIKKENDIFAYFEIVKELEPENILDAGMFLKRMGSVSRQMMNQGISEEIQLYGIDFFLEISLPAWNNVYDKIYTWQDFLQEKKQYHLGVVLGSGELEKYRDVGEIIERMRSCCRYLLLGDLPEKCKESIVNFKVQEIKIEGEVYYFVDNSKEWTSECM